MRRSLREAMVGFTLIAAVGGAGLFWLWLQGITLASRTWRFSVNFADATGLTARREQQRWLNRRDKRRRETVEKLHTPQASDGRRVQRRVSDP